MTPIRLRLAERSGRQALKVMERTRSRPSWWSEQDRRLKASCSSTICGERRCSDSCAGRGSRVAEGNECMTVDERVAEIKLLLFDVDGVLTDGVVLMHADGSEAKGFHIRDGAAMVWAQRAGLIVGLLSARSSGATTHRAAQLRFGWSFRAPRAARRLQRILRTWSRQRRRIHGRRSPGSAVLTAWPSAAPAVRRKCGRVQWVSTAGSSRGAVREFIGGAARAGSLGRGHPRYVHRPMGPYVTLFVLLALLAASPWARPGSDTNCKMADGSTGAGHASRRTTCWASTSSWRTRSIPPSRR